MSDILLSFEHENTTTNVSNVFIDKYLASANGSYVKVYLYLLRCLSGNGKSFSVSSAADFFEDTEGDITRALKYWEKRGILSLDFDGKEIQRIKFLDLNDTSDAKKSRISQANPIISIHNPVRPGTDDSASKKHASEPQRENTQDVTESGSKIPAAPAYHEFTADELTECMESKNMSVILNAVQAYYGHTLSPDDFNLVVYISRDLCFSEELLLFLYETCIGLNKKKTSYIQKVAINWHQNNIKTVDEARIYLQKYNHIVSAVTKAFGLNRTLGDRELKYVEGWQNGAFLPEVIKEACDRSLKYTNRPSFEYADKILTSWKAENITTLSDIAEYDKNKPSAASASKSYKKSASLSRSAENYNQRYNQRDYTGDEMQNMSNELVNESLRALLDEAN